MIADAVAIHQSRHPFGNEGPGNPTGSKMGRNRDFFGLRPKVLQGIDRGVDLGINTRL